MRILTLLLLMLLTTLQYRLWVSEDGFREVWRLEGRAEAQAAENQRLKDRNAQLDAEVEDLKSGFSALEERARSDLGMVGSDESFYLFGSAEADPDE
jgi:cell division protein FtsB